MIFQVGHRVVFLHEKGDGIILELKGAKALILDENGFKKWYFQKDIAVVHSSDYKIKQVPLKQEDVNLPKNKIDLSNLNIKKSQQSIWEIDLHIEELIESTHGMSNADILLKQMTEFRSVFSRAKAKSIARLVVIHGVGEGVLKNEIRSFLAKQDQIDVYDADFREYGKGATAIEFHPNW